MEKEEKNTLITAWKESALEDLETAKDLFKLTRYSGCLFFAIWL